MQANTYYFKCSSAYSAGAGCEVTAAALLLLLFWSSPVSTADNCESLLLQFLLAV